MSTDAHTLRTAAAILCMRARGMTEQADLMERAAGRSIPDLIQVINELDQDIALAVSVANAELQSRRAAQAQPEGA